jgi:ribokinase
VVVNPAPAMPLPAQLLATRPILTPNDAELALIAGGHSGQPTAAARELLDDGAAALLVTRGSDGVLVVTHEGEQSMSAERMGEVVDSTGAGDTFAGALAAFLSEGKEIVAAARAANAAAGLSVLKEGARGGMPRRAELEEYLASR